MTQTPIVTPLLSTWLGREKLLVVDELLDPVHKEGDVLGSREQCGLLVLFAAVLPVVLVPAQFVCVCVCVCVCVSDKTRQNKTRLERRHLLRATRHLGTRGLVAKVADSAVDEVDAVEEVDNCRGEVGKKSQEPPALFLAHSLSWWTHHALQATR